MASLSQIVQTRGWRAFMAKLYGWGASLVLIGALFKLQHWPFAGFFLVIGMVTEAIIFFFSAFEPMAPDTHWERVFPELSDDYDANATDGASKQVPSRNVRGGSGGGGIDLGLSAADVEGAQQGLKLFNQSMQNLTALASIADVSNNFAEGLRNSVGNVNSLNESMQVFSNAYQETAKSFVESGEQSNQNLNALNKNLNAVNASYELYIQGHQKYAQQNDLLISSMQQYVNQNNELISTMKAAGERSQQFGSHMDTLNQNIQNLNNIYGSMLTTVSAALKR